MPDALVFDLFGTLVFFDNGRLPVEEIAGRPVPQTIANLDEHLARMLPGCEKLDFLRALRRAGKELHDEKVRHGLEVTSDVRFAKALLALGADEDLAATESHALAASHMDSLARAVVCPPGRGELLRRLSARHRLALLSNFDHAATARRVLDEAGLSVFFEVIVVSAEEGVRKPSPVIFERCCRRLGVEAACCLFVGDTFAEDIEGAAAAGMPSVWVRAGASPADCAPACGVVSDVDELPQWLEKRGLSGPGAASR